MTWPSMNAAAFYGLAGDVVSLLEPHCEADPVVLLVDLLTATGSAAGPKAHVRVSGDLHPGRIFATIVGKSSRSRKGTAWSMVRAVMKDAAPDWVSNVLGGFGSGEAVVDAVGDSTDTDSPARDRRLLVRESEFARLLKVASRDGSTLSPIIREAWDGGALAVRSRSGTTVATGAHISCLMDVTVEELRRSLTQTDMANGFANRFLYVLARRSKRLPSGGNLDDSEVHDIAIKVRDVLEAAKTVGCMRRTHDADLAWSNLYAAIDDEVPGLVGSLLARCEAHILRLSVVYALLDGARQIGVQHLRAATAVWDYAAASAAYIFTDASGNEIADRLLVALREANADGGEGLDGTQQHELFGGHVSGKQLAAARSYLEACNLATTIAQPTGGRPRYVTFLADQAENANLPSLSSLLPLL